MPNTINISPDPFPAWVSSHDIAFDVSDWWRELIDPANDLGHTCSAYFERDEYGDLTMLGTVVAMNDYLFAIRDRQQMTRRVTESDIAALEADLRDFV